jgi:hypothetical protein
LFFQVRYYFLYFKTSNFSFSGKLTVEFVLTCQLATGASVAHPLTYHLLQDDRAVRRHTRQRIRRATTGKPPVFKQPLYVVSVREEGSKNHLVTAVPAVSPDGGRLRYSMVSLLDSR